MDKYESFGGVKYICNMASLRIGRNVLFIADYFTVDVMTDRPVTANKIISRLQSLKDGMHRTLSHLKQIKLG